MAKQYLSQMKKGSFWYMALYQGTCGKPTYKTIEAGRFIMDDYAGSTHCGREGFAIIYTHSGNGVLIYEDSSVLLPEGSVTMINCADAYELRKSGRTGRDWAYSWVRFNGEAAPFLFGNLNSENITAYMVEDLQQMNTEFSNIMELIQQPGCEAYFKLGHAVSTVLTIMLDLKCVRSHKRNRHQETVSGAMRYIWDNYDTPLDIERLSEEAKLSKYYFIKLFKEYASAAPYEYVIAHRVNEAKKYLRATGMQVSQISEAVGFNDECNFIRTFKKMTGITPLRYREQQK